MEEVKSLMERALAMAREKQNTASSTTETYKCPLCHDTGWVPCDDTYSAVYECKCVKVRRSERMLRDSGLADSLADMTIDSFVTDTAYQREMKAKAQQYIEEIISHSGKRLPWFYVGGNPGSGKTHICTAICGALLHAGISIKYMSWLNEARRLKSLVNDPEYDSVLDEYVKYDVLYIDDLIKQRHTNGNTECTPTEADMKIAFSIINARYVQNKALIVSSEWDLVDQLLPVDEATFSRVYERSKGYNIFVPWDTRNNFRFRPTVN